MDPLEMILYISSIPTALFPIFLFIGFIAWKEIVAKVRWFFDRSLCYVREIQPDHKVIVKLGKVEQGRLKLGEEEKIVDPESVLYNTGLMTPKKTKVKTDKIVRRKILGIPIGYTTETIKKLKYKAYTTRNGIPEFTYVSGNTYPHDHFNDNKFFHGKQLKNLLLMAESTTPDILNMLLKYKHIFLLLVALVIGVAISALFSYQSYNDLTNYAQVGIRCLPP